MHTYNNEKTLYGGQNAKSIVKIGNTVHRTKSPNYKFIHSLLQYLEKQNFSYAPRFLSMDDQDREISTYIEGSVPEIFYYRTNKK